MPPRPARSREIAVSAANLARVRAGWPRVAESSRETLPSARRPCANSREMWSTRGARRVRPQGPFGRGRCRHDNAAGTAHYANELNDVNGLMTSARKLWKFMEIYSNAPRGFTTAHAPPRRRSRGAPSPAACAPRGSRPIRGGSAADPPMGGEGGVATQRGAGHVLKGACPSFSSPTKFPKFL